jgi:isoleucyl-tRNA synthetase
MNQKAYNVNLPQTKFPMKGNSAVREVEIQRFWDTRNIYATNLAQRNIKKKFVLHDGPPYLSSSKIHIGTALNKILKDIVTKYKAQRGYYAPYVPGYDCHGLPIENAVVKDVKGGRAALTPLELRRRCRVFALGNLAGQEANFRRLGVWGDWEHPYITLDPGFEAAQLRVFGAMAEAGYLYKGLRPVQWCPNCETALAEAEVEYADHGSHEIWVKFPVTKDSLAKLPEAVRDSEAYFVIWTTTPWTLPANLGVAVHAQFDYLFLQSSQGVLVVAEALKARFLEDMGWQDSTVSVLARVRGSELDRLSCRHPFVERESLVMVGDHVTDDVGTGVVHTAPGHGPEDFILGARYGIGVLSPLDERGIFTADGGKFAGMRYDRANKPIVEHLEELGRLLKHSTYTHSYPHCWRCKKPLVFRATEQWFASVDGFRKQALAAIDEVTWIPASGRNRIYAMVENRADWCISRQRSWGVPIPVFYCQQCKKPVVTGDTVERVARAFDEAGSDSWWENEAVHFLGEDFRCPHCGGAGFDKEQDIMDVWFDSGTTHAGVIDRRPELGGTPCEMYLEGSDQHRGWFQSSLLTSVAVHNRAPYKIVLTHGFVVDENGRKMSKSTGNIVEPDDVIKHYGADVLRLWVASVNYTDDIPIGKGMLAQLAEVYRKLRNTARFLLGNLHDFAPEYAVRLAELSGLDAYILHRLQEVVAEVIEDFDNYEFFKYYQLLQNFCVVDLSSFYFDIIKDRLYTCAANATERRAAQTVLNEILQVLVRLLVPVTPHLAEDIWQHMDERLRGKQVSVLLTDFPEPRPNLKRDALSQLWKDLIAVRQVVNRGLEQARAAGSIGSSLEASVMLQVESAQLKSKIATLGTELPGFFITSQACVLEEGTPLPPLEECLSQVSDTCATVAVLPAQGVKCARCWKFTKDVGSKPDYGDLCLPCTQALAVG